MVTPAAIQTRIGSAIRELEGSEAFDPAKLVEFGKSEGLDFNDRNVLARWIYDPRPMVSTNRWLYAGLVVIDASFIGVALIRRKPKP